jgi:hypothetical protein
MVMRDVVERRHGQTTRSETSKDLPGNGSGACPRPAATPKEQEVLEQALSNRSVRTRDSSGEESSLDATFGLKML